MKIIYCTDDLWQGGGTERVLTTKLNWWATQPDVKVWVVTLQDEKEPFFKLSDDVVRVTMPIGKKDAKNYLTALTKVISDIDPDVVVSVSGLAVDTVPLIKTRAKKVLEFHYTKNFLVNFVNGLHSIRFRQLHLLKMRYLQWRLGQTAKKYDLFVGLTARDVGLWGNPKNMTYVYNPLSFRSEHKSTCDNHKIIAVGSFTPAKGMDQLIKAFGLIAKDYPGWSVDIYGDGQDEQYLRELIKEYDIEAQVTLYSPVKNIGEKIVEASIYAFPSRSDGFGLVITEAMECGLPTVAMDCPCGPREIVTNDTGIVVPEQDIEAFAKALAKLMGDDKLRKQMGFVAQTEVGRFYPDNIMPCWLRLFKLTMENAR